MELKDCSTDCKDLPSEMSAADSQMTTGFFMLQPVTGWETNYSQMTTGFCMLQPVKDWETNHSQMTMGLLSSGCIET